MQVDMTQAARKIYMVHETIPVRPGPLTLYYPKWLPGYHAPSGPITEVAGLRFSASGQQLAWRRDLVDPFAIHLVVPKDVDRLDVDYDVLAAVRDLGLGDGDKALSPAIADLEWNQVVFYPAGYASKAITFQPSVVLPDDWHYATALVPHVGTGGNRPIRFAAVTLNQLVDSPVVSGRYFRQVDLAPGARVPVELDMVADAPADLAITPKQVDGFRQLVVQENRMFGTRHYAGYHMLVTLSDHISELGLEHHQSFDIRASADDLVDADAFLAGASEFAHEYTHSWNGKFRRPDDLWTPDFNSVPMKGDLLWVYEGLTEYWADVMATRAGFWTPSEFRQALAMTAAQLDHVPGRSWQSLQDTADMASRLYYVPSSWKNWRRGTDFYPEGVLVWLNIDTKLRELSQDHRSLDDFARRFYGMDDGSDVTRTYTFADVVDALNAVQPYDWATFLRRMLDAHADHAPLDGLARGGYQLAYTGMPSTMWKARISHDQPADDDAMYSVGFDVKDDGEVVDVLWNGPAFKAGLIPGMRVTAVNSRAFSPDALDDAVAASGDARNPIALLVENDGQFETLHVDYRGGLRYPQLVRGKGTPDYLDQIVAPVKP
ncbi:M61 family metallopeptidase [Rhodanobacter sp. Si-c]|uniref:M61 family metallopeptidase n=1 Tax=Rhodanobacter lycopersici TaxID=3162487 RepID=A0ABV3QF92_9GAMM